MFSHFKQQNQYTHPNHNTPSQLETAVEKASPSKEQEVIASAPNGPLQRLPTLHDVIQRRTQSPLDLWAFYVYMRDQHHSVDYLDFWLDAASHLSLCKHYVRGLGEGVLNNRESLRFLEQDRTDESPLLPRSPQVPSRISDINHSGNDKRRSEFSDASFLPLQAPGFRESIVSEESRYRSVDSSILLELLKKGDMFEGDGSHRLSQFLRDGLLIDERTPDQPVYTPERADSYTKRRLSSITPYILEKALAQAPESNLLVTRDHLQESSRHLLLTYFGANAPKKLFLPESITREVVKAVEIEGRDDPEVFSAAKDWVFGAMQDDAFPGFLAGCGICNITNKSYMVRLVIGMFLLFLTFWLGYLLIFLDTPKKQRVPVFIPFFVALYLVLSALYYLCPVMVFCGLAESPSVKWGLIRLREPFVKRLLMKRSLYILGWMVLITAGLSLVFILVPGTRL